MFDGIINVLDNIINIDESDAWMFVIDNEESKEEIIRLNTEDQLYERGVDSMEVSLGEYAPYTISRKIVKGDRYDHVTLKDEGRFYDSFIVIVDRNGFTIIADDFSVYDQPLSVTYGLDILGLTKENMYWLGEFIRDKYTEYVIQQLLR